MSAKELPGTAIAITKDLWFCLVDETFRAPNSSKSYVYFSSEKNLIYTAFFADFGPLNLGLMCTFCSQLQELLASSVREGKAVVVYASNPQSHSNFAVLVCAYQIFVLGYSAEKAYAPFMGRAPFIPFRDAAFCINTWPLFVIDCVRAMGKAVSLGHFHYPSFNAASFKKLSQLENGDVSWIVPGKFIAFSGPLSKRRSLGPGVSSLLPEEYVPIFKQLGVSCVVRFNNKCYDKAVFERSGIKHVDLFYEDGGNPTEAILQSFLKLCESESGAIAVHCKAGLGRTGTNIVAYMVKHFGYTVREATAWHRLCRPGAVVGPQQQYLQSIEQKLQQEGEQYRSRTTEATKNVASPSRDSCAPVSACRIGRPGTAGSSVGVVPLPRPDSFPPRGSGEAAAAAAAAAAGAGYTIPRVSTASSTSSRQQGAGGGAANPTTPNSGAVRPLFGAAHSGSGSGSGGSGSSPTSPQPVSVAAMGVRSDREASRISREERQRERAARVN